MARQEAEAMKWVEWQKDFPDLSRASLRRAASKSVRSLAGLALSWPQSRRPHPLPCQLGLPSGHPLSWFRRALPRRRRRYAVAWRARKPCGHLVGNRSSKRRDPSSDSRGTRAKSCSLSNSKRIDAPYRLQDWHRTKTGLIGKRGRPSAFSKRVLRYYRHSGLV